MWNFILFLVFNPVIWLGLLISFILSYRRIRLERRQFSIAIEPKLMEVKNYLISGLRVGLLSSLITLILGVSVTRMWVQCYLLVSIVGLLMTFVFWDSGILLVLTGILAYYLTQQGIQLELGTVDNILNSAQIISPAGSIFVLAVTLFCISQLLKQTHTWQASPKLRLSQRGLSQAFITMRQLYLVPLILAVPGKYFPSMGHLWPFFMVSGQRFNVIILPLILGFSLKLKKRLPNDLAQLSPLYLTASLLVTGFSLLDRWLAWDVVFLVLSCIIVLSLKIYQSQFLTHGKHDLLAAPDGLRVLAVQKHTPAAKAGVKPGDVILEVNDRSVHTSVDFYSLIQIEPTFVRLRIRTIDNSIKLAETAIYTDSPHELGIITFPDKMSRKFNRGSWRG